MRRFPRNTGAASPLQRHRSTLFSLRGSASFSASAPSSNGRTSVFGSENGGSNPPGAMMRLFISLAAAAILASPAILSAQQPGAQSHATITGVAVDSVRGGYLRGAIVSVSGTALSAITDSVGRFRIDSVPPGTRYLAVMHPLLDSLSLIVRSPQREIAAGANMSFILSVPSAKTIVGAKCGVADLARGPAALFGTVQDADTETPANGATVSVEWTDYQLSKTKIARMPQRRLGTVRPDGTYRV